MVNLDLRNIGPHKTRSQPCYQLYNVVLLRTVTEQTHLLQMKNDVALASLS